MVWLKKCQRLIPVDFDGLQEW